MNQEKLMVVNSEITLTCDNESDAAKLRSLDMKDPLGNPIKVDVVNDGSTMKIPKDVNPFTEPEKVAEFNRLASLEKDHFDLHDAQLAANYEVGEAPDQSEEIKRRYGDGWHLSKNIEFLAPDKNSLACSVLSHAIQDVENLGGFKVVAAIVDLNKDADISTEDRIQCYSTVESKKLREVIYKEMERER